LFDSIRGRGVGIRLDRIAYNFRCQLRHFIRGDRAEAGHGRRIVEIPSALDKADKIPDRRIGGPGAPKCRTGQVRWHSRAKESGDVGVCGDRINRWQIRKVEGLIAGLGDALSL
jgi:hypothetical protein